jgi:hypothetical protein
MKIAKLIRVILVCLATAMSSVSYASIPQAYFPAYSYQYMNIHSSADSPSSSSMRTPASINRAALMMAAPSKIFYGNDGAEISPELIANYNQVKSNDKPLDMRLIIPLDMQPSSDSSAVMAQVADRSMTSFLNSSAVRESTVGRAATTVEQKMKQEVVFGSNDSKSIQHKLNFNLQAFQALAQIQYTGYTNAAIKYKIAESKVALEMFEKFYGNHDVVLSHTIGRDNRVSELSVRWTF